MVSLKNCSLDQIHEIFQGKTIYGYGAGKYLDNFRERYPEIPIEYYLYKIIDKSPNVKRVGDKNIGGISVEDVRASISPKDIILITTCNYYTEIISELDSYTELDGIEVYILPFIEANFQQDKVNWELYRRCRREEEIIPRIIHYCWFGGKEIHDNLQRYMESWKIYCPDYTIMRWTEENYDITKNRYMHEAYQNKKWAFVSDYARLDIVNEYGGIYLDTDVELVKPLDELLHFNGFMGLNSGKLINTGLGFGSIRNNSILKTTLEIYNSMQFVKENGELDLSPCTKMQREACRIYGFKDKNELQVLDDNFMILPTSFLAGMNWGTRQLEMYPHTYAIHHYQGSWLSVSEKEIQDRANVSDDLLRRMEQKM